MFERFGLLQGRGWPSDEGFEKIAAIAVDAFVAEHLEIFYSVAEKGQRGAGEVKGVAVKFEDDFYDVGIGDDRIFWIERIRGGDHVQARVIAESFGEIVDQCGINEWFVALDIEDVSGVWDLLDGLGESVGSGRMVR